MSDSSRVSAGVPRDRKPAGRQRRGCRHVAHRSGGPAAAAEAHPSHEDAADDASRDHFERRIRGGRSSPQLARRRAGAGGPDAGGGSGRSVFLTGDAGWTRSRCCRLSTWARDPGTEYLSDGISESIINNLSQLPKLSVRSFSSVSRYRGKDVSPDAAGKELKVPAVLTGRLVKRGDEFAISAELIDVRHDRQIWGSQYTRKVADIMAMQEQISREISEKLRLRLSGSRSSA